jgi:mevalonate kinase
MEGRPRLSTKPHVTYASAPGKVILFGEHAVVYGRPALAVPVTDVQAVATIDAGRPEPGVTIRAHDIGRTIDVGRAEADEPLSLTVRNTLSALGLRLEQVRLAVHVRSSIPIASGMGSGAAVATAVVRALGEHLGHPLDAGTVSSLVYETERVYHGTPSGIDNTVVAFEQPVYFRRGDPIVVLGVGQPFWVAIADSGVPSLTRQTVADVRSRWQRCSEAYEQLFDRIGALVDAAKAAIEGSEVESLGPLMDENQALLRQLGVSSPELERLIEAARTGGAQGAKLSGGGVGGNIVAAVAEESVDRVRECLLDAGAVQVIVTRVER